MIDDIFSRTRLLIGEEKLAVLNAARVAVIGLGAVGSYAVESLTRAGVGNLLLIDFDTIRHSNFNRQLFAVEHNLNRLKIDAARERVLSINSACNVECRKEFVDGTTIQKVFDAKPDMIVDAIDSLGPKAHCMAACVSAGVRFISSLGAASRMDPLAVRVGDISETEMCPFARMIRKKLHRMGIYTGVRCVYSVESPRGQAACADVEPEDGGYARGRTRKSIGSISFVPGMFGLVAACDVVKTLIGENAPEQYVRTAPGVKASKRKRT
jgi:tRNA threonylcarbamoyladenosine dehydratase